MSASATHRLAIGITLAVVSNAGFAVAGAALPIPFSESPTRVRSGQLTSAEIQPATVGAESRSGAEIATPQWNHGGRSHGDWVVKWWRWALGTPAAVNPLLDPNSTNCGAGDQPSRVRFLGGNFGGQASDPPVVRSCSVPAGTAFFFPVLNGVWASTPKANKGCDIAADPWYGTRPGDPGFRQFIKKIYRRAGIDPKNPEGSLTLKIDGKSVVGIEDRYVRSRVFFNALLPDDNIFDALFGINCFNRILVTPDVGYGYHVFLYPLSPGRHTVRWTADAKLPLLGPDLTPALLHQDVTYHLTVRAPR